MAYTAITNDEIQVKKPVRQELMQKIKDNFDDHETKLSAASGAETIPNSSFEVDSDADGIPDNWTRYLYPGGSGGFETTNPAHGAKAYKFVHPGGTGNGGGYLESEYIKINQLERYVLSFIHWATAAAMKNIVQILFYDLDKVYISDVNIYDSKNNPASATFFLGNFLPPANARFVKVRLVGGYDTVDVAGTAYFDEINFTKYFNSYQAIFRRDATEYYTTSTSFADTSLQFTLYDIPAGIQLRWTAEIKSESTNAFYQRWRIGSVYSNEQYSVSATYATFPFSLSPVNSGDLTLIMQLMATSASYGGYGRKSSDSIYLEPL